MAKTCRGRRRLASRQRKPTPYPLPCYKQEVLDDLCPKKCSMALEKKDMESITCSVCMEYPHNAVLLLCSSHDKGCRPYMCGTSFRYSNCLDQYKQAYSKISPSLACPLCRGQVKGWTVVEPTRLYLNSKSRNCMQENCPFLGSYKELRKHMRADHPYARPREVDPTLEQKWRSLEHEQERDDVMSTIRSSMPGAIVYGDYVIEGNQFGFDTDDDDEDNEVANGRGFEVGGFNNNLVNVLFMLSVLDSAESGWSERRLRSPDHVIPGDNDRRYNSDTDARHSRRRGWRQGANGHWR